MMVMIMTIAMALTTAAIPQQQPLHRDIQSLQTVYAAAAALLTKSSALGR